MSHATGSRAPRPGTDFGNSNDLKPFADQLMAIANQLQNGDFLSAGSDHDTQTDTPSGSRKGQDKQKSEGDPRARYAAIARETYATRRLRTAIFGDAEIFSEPAWDILLDLYVAFADAKSVSVSSACIGSASPPTTGLRWLGVLAEKGLVMREQDPEDQRRVMVRLTNRGLEAMDQYFASVSSD